MSHKLQFLSRLLVIFFLAPASHGKKLKKEPMNNPPLASSNGDFYINYNFNGTVLEKPPELEVVLTNVSEKPIKFFYLDQPTCFFKHYIKVNFNKSPGTPPVPILCNLDKVKKIETLIAPKNNHNIKFLFNEIFASDYAWEKGMYSIDFDWNDGIAPKSKSVRNSNWALAKPLMVFKIKMNETIELPDGAAFKFTGHSHKSVDPGSVSPLMVYGDFKNPTTKEFKPYYQSVFYSENKTLSFSKEFFGELKSYVYDDWMEIIYFGKP